MKTNFKKVLCAFLVVVMCLTMAPLQGFTELELPDFEIGNLFSTTAKAATQGYYTYTVSNGEATITDVDEAISGAITIPSTLGGYPVTIIGDMAFRCCEKLTNIIIPESVTNIEDMAFLGCVELESIIIPDSVNSIGEGTFEGCISLESITIPDSVTIIGDMAFRCCEKLTNIIIPESVTSIEDMAFLGCVELESITIPNSVTSIGDYAFYDCDSLTSITIPNSVTSIGNSAFNRCTSLTSITIPDSVTVIEVDVFSGCISLKNITLPDNLTYIYDGVFAGTAYYNNPDNWSDGVLYIGNYLIDAQANNIPNSYEIKEGTKLIAEAAFSNCSNLADITIPDSVTSINQDAFSETAYYNNPENWTNNVLYIGDCLIDANEIEISGDCTIKNGTRLIADFAFMSSEKLDSVTIPDTVTTIGKCAFYLCSGIDNITIPDSVTNLGIGAFGGTNISRVTVPASVTSMGYGVFLECHNLEFITVDENNNYFCNDDAGVLFNRDRTKLLQYPAGKQSETYVTPTSVTSLDRAAFGYCNNLKEVAISGAVKIISNDAFACCENLESITIPNSVARVYRRAFVGCETLTDVYFIGTEEEWNNINISSNNECLTQANIHFICPHSATKELPAKEATCTETGYTAGIQCTMCDEILVAQTEIPVKDHSYNTSVTLPTCTATGYTTYTCSVCGDTYKADEVAMLEHTMGEWTVTKSATCEEKGTEERTCIYCDYSETREIAETDHTDNDNDGYCDNCGTDISDTDEPGTGEPGTDEPGTDEPGTDESEDSASCVN